MAWDVMSLLRFFQKDPTVDWSPARGGVLVFDAHRSEMNGIGFGAPLAALRALGRPSNPSWRRVRHCAYPAAGLEVGLDAADRVLFFTCLFQRVDSVTDLGSAREFKPCRLHVQLAGGEAVEITSDSTLVNLQQHLGPLTREEVGGELMWSLTIGSSWFGLGFDDDGRIEFADVEPAPSPV